MRRGGGIYQLSGNPQARSGLANAALEHVAHAKLASDLPDIDRLVSVSKARLAGDDEQRSESRQRRDDVFDQSVGEVILTGLIRHVLERKHGDRWFVGWQGRYRCCIC